MQFKHIPIQLSIKTLILPLYYRSMTSEFTLHFGDIFNIQIMQWPESVKLQVIGDVANWKHHQRLDEILIFFLPALHRSNQQSCLPKKLCHVIRPRNLTKSCLHSIHLLQYACFIQHKLLINVRVSDIVFLQTTLLISCIMPVKIIKISSSHWWRLELARSAIKN